MTRPSLALRAMVAVTLLVGFYVLALGLAGLLLWIPYAQWAYAGRIHLQFAVFGVLGAGSILLSIVPRRDRFVPPGPRLEAREHPALFRVLSHVAKGVGQELPRDVYLVADMNAWVANRGGVLGFGSHRVMGVGLPLLQVVDVAQLEAILAHEFGHYHGGDTRLGPWIHKTRTAIGRTLESLGNEGWLHLPFRWYGTLFLRLTQAISRAQEFAADRLAAMLVGAGPLIEGLKAVHAYAGAFNAYWRGEAVPVLEAGFHAPIARGFAEFLRAPGVENAVSAALEEGLQSRWSDPLDSHPPLAARIEAVKGLVRRERGGKNEPAITLLGDVARAERALLAFFSSRGAVQKFRAVDWSAVPEEVFLPVWRRQAEAIAPAFGRATLEQLPALLRTRAQDLARRVLRSGGSVPEERALQVLQGPVGAALAVALHDTGWSLSAGLARPVRLRRGDTAIEPFAVLPGIVDPESELHAEWNALLAHEGIGHLPLCGGGAN